MAALPETGVLIMGVLIPPLLNLAHSSLLIISQTVIRPLVLPQVSYPLGIPDSSHHIVSKSSLNLKPFTLACADQCCAFYDVIKSVRT